MANINYFALSAALGVTIGPRSRVLAGPQHYQQATLEMAALMEKRRPHFESLQEIGGSDRQYIAKVKKAFDAVREEFSPDRVVADPRLNRPFLSHCEAFGLDDDPFSLNWTLLNLRKNGELQGLKSRKSLVPGQWRYAYASELAARSIFYRFGATVDRIICHPSLVKEFDQLARSLAPGYSAFEYRWAALNIRKKGASVPSQWHLSPGKVHWSEPLAFDASNTVPEQKGIYVLNEEATALYVANTEDLHSSVQSQHSLVEVPLLEPDLWHPDPKKLFWRYVSLPEFPSVARYGLVNQLVGSLNPIFNIPRAA